MSRILVFYNKFLTRIKPKFVQSTEDRLRRLIQQHPCHYEFSDRVVWAQHCLGRAANTLGYRHRDAEQICGNAQAHRSYAIGVAIGFYAVSPRRNLALLLPVPGSEWSTHQLNVLQSLGLEHGRYIRIKCTDP